MRKFESDCVGCSPPLRCLGITCPNIKKVERYYCDECGYEGTLYKYDGRELCEDCAVEEFRENELPGYEIN